jgi:hypothetical protein
MMPPLETRPYARAWIALSINEMLVEKGKHVRVELLVEGSSIEAWRIDADVGIAPRLTSPCMVQGRRSAWHRERGNSLYSMAIFA